MHSISLTESVSKHVESMRVACVLLAAAISLGAANGQNLLVTGKSITLPPLGTQQNVGSLPMQIIVSPNGRFAVTSDMGLRQSLWSIHTSNGQGVSNVEFFNNPDLMPRRTAFITGSHLHLTACCMPRREMRTAL